MHDGPPDDAILVLAAAAEGLLVPSETDAPLTPFRWEGEGPLSPEALLVALGLPPNTPAETRTLDEFFAPLARLANWMDADQRERAGRFAALRDLIASVLTDVAVYRIGRTQITVIIAGQDARGDTVGLRTTRVET